MGLTQFLEAGAAVGSVLVSSITAIRSKKDQQISHRLVQEQNRLNQEQNRINRVYSKIEARQKATEIHTNHIISLNKGELKAEDYACLRFKEKEDMVKAGQDLNRWSVNKIKYSDDPLGKENEEALRFIDFNSYYTFQKSENENETVQIVEKYPGAAEDQKSMVKDRFLNNEKLSNSPFASISFAPRKSFDADQVNEVVDNLAPITGIIDCDVQALRDRFGFETINDFKPTQSIPISPTSALPEPKGVNTWLLLAPLFLVALLTIKRLFQKFKRL